MRKIYILFITLLVYLLSFQVSLAESSNDQALIDSWTQKVISLIEKYHWIVPSWQIVSLLNYHVDRASRSSDTESINILYSILITLYDRGYGEEIASRYTSPTGISLILPTDISSAIYYSWTWLLPYEYEWGVNIKNYEASSFGAENNFSIQVDQLTTSTTRQQLEQTMTVLANERIEALYEWQQIDSTCLYDFEYTENIPWIERFWMWRDMKYGDECQWSWFRWVRNKQTWKFWYRTWWWHDPSFYVSSPYIQAERLSPKQRRQEWNNPMYILDPIIHQSITIQ